jgi:hypothetical protein
MAIVDMEAYNVLARGLAGVEKELVGVQASIEACDVRGHLTKIDDALDDLKATAVETRQSTTLLVQEMGHVKEKVADVERQVTSLNGTVRDHDKDITVLKEFEKRATPLLEKIGDMRVELAKLGAVGGGMGLVFGAILAIGKGAGWW